jgi:hypothetical protein
VLPFPFAELHTALFASLGEPVTLQRGDDPPVTVSAVVRLGVANVGEFGRVVGSRTVVSLPRDRWQPRRGDLVTVRGNTHTVESIASDDGYVVEAVLHG